MGFFKNLFGGSKNNKKEQNQTQVPNEPWFVITLTNSSVSVRNPDGKVNTINWNEIETIDLLTTSDGPVLPDVWLALRGNGKTCLAPQGYDGYQELYDIVSTYEGFDFKQVIHAMSSVEEAQFPLWKRPEGFVPSGKPVDTNQTNDSSSGTKYGYHIVITDEKISVTNKDNKVTEIRWNAITSAAVMHLLGGGDKFPSRFIVLYEGERGCAIPEGETGFDTVFNRIQQFPGFETNQYHEATQSDETGTPIIFWTKGGGGRPTSV